MSDTKALVSHATALALSALAASCNTVLDGTDREAFSLAARVRKRIEGPMPEKETFVEGAWIHTKGDTREFDFDFDTVNAGLAFEDAVGDRGRVAVGAGLSVLANRIDSDLGTFDDDFSVGPYLSIEGGWRATDVVEPYGRADVALYLLEFSTALTIELGVRFHLADHVALFGGWRYGHYDLQDIDGVTSVDRVDLDASGVLVGLSLEF